MSAKKNDEVEILIVEDNAAMSETLSDILNEEGYKVTRVGTLAEAKNRVSEKYYDIVLLDINLPDGLGTDILHTIEKQEKKSKAIILTGAADVESAVFAVNKGAFAYLRKPVDMNILKKYITKATA